MSGAQLMRPEIKEQSSPSCDVVIYVAGDYDDARRICRGWCERGACVSVQRVAYIYTGGEEVGVAVRFINYPRFPVEPAELMRKARELAETLIHGLHQSSASIVGPKETIWLSRRELP